MRTISLVTGLLLLFAAEILRVYFIMPFPGSQHRDTLPLAYFIGRNIWVFRAVGFLLVVYPAWLVFTQARPWKKISLLLVAGLYGLIFFFFNFRFEADKMFHQPGSLRFAGAPATNTIDSNRLVIGIVLNGQSKAYPVQLIGYHHQVRDSIGNIPVMVTYCTVCRTGRVYRPEVDGRPETFRLVGMDHFNAMFEDSRTKSWWQQATGKAVAGPLKGHVLAELSSTQSTLRDWYRGHPGSLVMLPDTQYRKKYKQLDEYDRGLTPGSLEKRDSASWKDKSWVVGLRAGDKEKAYDWNQLVKDGLFNDKVGNTPVLLWLEQDTTTFHAWDRSIGGRILSFRLKEGQLTDTTTRSVWSPQGKCLSGELAGLQLEPVAAYQEFWHSWKQFHPATLQYHP